MHYICSSPASSVPMLLGSAGMRPRRIDLFRSSWTRRAQGWMRRLPGAGPEGWSRAPPRKVFAGADDFSMHRLWCRLLGQGEPLEAPGVARGTCCRINYSNVYGKMIKREMQDSWDPIRHYFFLTSWNIFRPKFSWLEIRCNRKLRTQPQTAEVVLVDIFKSQQTRCDWKTESASTRGTGSWWRPAGKNQRCHDGDDEQDVGFLP